MESQDHFDFPVDFFDSLWSRWVPGNTFYLILLVGTASRRGIDGSLDDLIEHLGMNLPHIYPELGNTPIKWGDPEDAERDAQRLTDAVSHVAAPPKTIADFAEVLATLGVFEHSRHGEAERWRIRLPLPLPTEVLHLDEETRTKEDEIRWNCMIDNTASQNILQVIYELESDLIETTLEQFARRCHITPDSCRLAMASLVESTELIVTRRGEPVIDVERLPVHARIAVAPQWEQLAENRIHVRLASDNE